MTEQQEAAVSTWVSAEGAQQFQSLAVRRAFNQANTDRMLELAALKPGYKVLDIAAGSGEQSGMVAQRVGPNGSVLAIDVSPAMLRLADKAMNDAGFSWVETRLLDAREAATLGEEVYDAAISRNGLQFVPDLVAALRAIRGTLKPGARLAAMVMSHPGENPHLRIPTEIGLRYLKTPPAPGARTPMSLGAPGLFEQSLRDAGFRDVSVEPRPVYVHDNTLEEAVTHLTQLPTPLSALLPTLSDAEREAALAEVRSALEPFTTPEGIVMQGTALVGVGTR